MTTHVYSGPSVPRAAVERLLPGAVHHPPVRHGDLVALDPGPGDRVAVVDGVFQQSASVRHKEIAHLLACGVEVWGSSSMGALRAAELDTLGMRGSGTVYRLYAGGLLDRDDEVALVHTDADDGARPLTVAMVSVRVLLRSLRRHGRLSGAAERAAVAAAAALPYPDRTWRTVLATARITDADRAEVTAATAAPDRSWDVKSRDAVRLLTLLARTPVTGGSCPVEVPWTTHMERWRRRARPEQERLVTAAALYAVDYPDLHRDVVLGLAAAEDGPHSGWDAERLVREYRWAGGLAPVPALAGAVAASRGGARVAEAVAGAERLNADLAERGRAASSVSRSAVLRHVARRWEVADDTGLETAARSRGFRGLDDLTERVGWLLPHLALTPPDPIALAHGRFRR